jgi:hypothetical protein
MGNKPRHNGAKGETPNAESDQNADYDVGYRKPPVASQFKPGTSGNPRGRPKGVRSKKTVGEIFLKEASRKIPVIIDGRKLKMPAIDAVIRSIFALAMKGDVRSQKLILEKVMWAQQGMANQTGGRITPPIDVEAVANDVKEQLAQMHDRMLGPYDKERLVPKIVLVKKDDPDGDDGQSI